MLLRIYLGDLAQSHRNIKNFINYLSFKPEFNPAALPLYSVKYLVNNSKVVCVF